MAVNTPISKSDLGELVQENIQDNYIFDKIAEQSVIQRVTPESPLTQNGTGVPVFNDTLEAFWTDEGTKKGASKATGSVKHLTPHTLAVVIPVTKQVLATINHNWFNKLQDKVISKFATAFDYACLHGSIFGADNNLDATTNEIVLGAGTPKYYADLVNARAVIENSGEYDTSAFVFDVSTRQGFYNASDAQNRPLFNDGIFGGSANPDRQASLIGLPAYLQKKIKTATTVGYAGDFSQATWGQVGAVEYKVFDQGAVTINGNLVSAIENNLLIIRAEADFGFLVNDKDAFVKFAPEPAPKK
jgi:HK97 family phage major capsid protein